MAEQVIVLGAGLAGLTAALVLADAGLQVVSAAAVLAGLGLTQWLRLLLRVARPICGKEEADR